MPYEMTARKLDDGRLHEVSRELADADPLDVLRWAAAEFGRTASFGTGFGVEGCALIHLVGTYQLPIDLFTLDTGLFFAETYALWRQLEQRYGLTIRGVRPTDEGARRLAGEPEDPLWVRDPDQCCRLRKVLPLREALRHRQGWITAIRADQTADRATAQVVEWDARFGLIKINPLLRWSSERLWRFVREHDILHNPLHHRGYPSIGCWPCTTPACSGEDPRAGRWRGRPKTECGLHGRFVTDQRIAQRRTTEET